MQKETNHAHKIRFLVLNEQCLVSQVLKANQQHTSNQTSNELPPGIKVLLDYQLSQIKKFYGGPLRMM